MGPFRYVPGDGEVMRCGNDGLPLLMEPVEELDEPYLRTGVKAARRLIHQEHVGVCGKARSNGDLLLLAVRKRVGRAVVKVLDPQGHEQSVDDLFHLRLGKAELERPECHILPDRGREELHIGVLKNEGTFFRNSLPNSRSSRACSDSTRPKAGPPLLSEYQAVQQCQDRRFAGAVGPRITARSP